MVERGRSKAPVPKMFVISSGLSIGHRKEGVRFRGSESCTAKGKGNG